MGSSFESIVGAAHVRPLDDAELDGVPLSQAVHPGDAEEVAACLRLAAQDGIALLPRGGGTRLGWGNVGAAMSWVVLDLSRLCDEPDVDPDEGVVRVAAGVPVAELARRLEALDRTSRMPAGAEGATVGGAVATDPPDPGRSLDRALRIDLLGLQVALANGTLSRAGGRVVKNVTGFDLVRLYCGSLGTLGVVTEVVLRLRPRPEARRVLGRDLDSIDAAQETVADLIARGAEPDAALLDARGGRVRVLWLLEGMEDDVQERADRVPGERVEPSLWSQAAEHLFGAADASRATVRLGGRSTDLARLWRALEAWAGADGMAIGLPLSGSVRAHGPAQGLSGLVEEAARAEWSIFIEACPAHEKRRHDVFGAASAAQPLLASLKRQFDPRGILAPGRFMGRL